MTDAAVAMSADWRSRLTTYLLGTASGVAINLLSGADAYRAIAASVTIAALVAASAYLRKVPARAPLVRHSTRLLVILGLADATLVVVAPPSFTPYLIFVAVGLTMAAVIIPEQHLNRVRVLVTIAALGAGIGGTTAGIVAMTHGDAFTGTVTAIVALVGAFAGFSSRPTAWAVAVVGLAVVAIVWGAGLTLTGWIALGLVVLGVGVLQGVVGLLLLTNGRVPRRMRWIIAALERLPNSDLAFEMAFSIIGCMAIGTGILVLARVGFAPGKAGFDLVALGAVVMGIAAVGLSVYSLSHREPWHRARQWAGQLIREPENSATTAASSDVEPDGADSTEDRSVWEIRIILYATEGELRQASHALTRALCSDEPYDGRHAPQWTMTSTRR